SNKESWRPNPDQVQAAVQAAIALEKSGLPAGGRAGAADAPAAAAGEGETATGAYYGGLTPLLFAVREGNTEAVKALLDGGANVNKAREGDSTSPMLLAAINGHYDLVKLLLDRGGDPNV